jgi:hypothetical protein
MRYFLAGAILIYLIVFRVMNGWIHIPNLDDIDRNLSDNTISQIFILNLPDFVLFFLLFAMLFDRHNNIVHILGTLAITVSLISLLSNVLFFPNPSDQINSPAVAFTWKYIFIGGGNDQLLYFVTFLNFTLGSWYVCSHKTKIFSCLAANVFLCVVYYLYVLLIFNIYTITSNVSGLSQSDYDFGGSHYFFSWITKMMTNGYQYWVVSLLFYISFFVGIQILTLSFFKFIQRSDMYYVPENKLIYEWNRFHDIKQLHLLGQIDDSRFEKADWKTQDGNLPYNKKLEELLEK